MWCKQLTKREKEVLGFMAEGLSNRRIAERLSTAKCTVDSHTRNIYRKLAVGNRTEAVVEFLKVLRTV